MPIDSIRFKSTPRLELVVKHLSAVRQLDDYARGGAMQKDIQALRNQLRQTLNRELPEHWERLEDHKEFLYSRPQKKWGVVKGDYIALEVYLALPVGDDNSDDTWVGLYVPPNWKKKEQFLKELKTPQGFDHAHNYPEDERDENCPIWKYVKYPDHAASDGAFDWPGFMKAIREAVVSIVGMEQHLDAALKQLH
jgi:hypothetical protein